MIIKFVLIVWIGAGQSQTLTTQTFETYSECQAVASVLKTEIDKRGWYKCVKYEYKPNKNS